LHVELTFGIVHCQLLSRSSMRNMQSAMLFHRFSPFLCPSLHPSRCGIFSKQSLISLKLFPPSDKGHHSNFLSSSEVTKYQGEPAAGQLRTRNRKICIFDRNRRFSRKRCETGRWLL